MSSHPNRPRVDVVVPFSGSAAAFADAMSRLERLALAPADTLTLVDNRPRGGAAVPATCATVVRAPEVQSSYFARNCGAAVGHGDWLLFLDADVDPPPDLVDRYFAELPVEQAAVLAGGVVDEPLEIVGHHPATVRYSMLRASMSQANTLVGPWPYAQTANCAIRRTAFEEAGGFCDRVRSGGDADLCWRLRAAGWEIEPRECAAVIHRSRRTLRTLMRQRARHGSGAAWLGREHPGAFPRKRWPGLAKWTIESFVRAGAARIDGRRDDALVACIDPLSTWAFELGRLLPNEVRTR